RNDLTDRLLNFCEAVRAFFDARPDLHACMHENLAGIHRWKKVSTQERHQREGAEHKNEKSSHEYRATSKGGRQKLVISRTQCFETSFERALKAHRRVSGWWRSLMARGGIVDLMFAQQVVRHCRH